MNSPTYTIYILFDGTSEDGRGQAHFVKSTPDKDYARRHLNRCRKSPYNFGYVQVLTDISLNQISDPDLL